MNLSLVIACYNEAAHLKESFNVLQGILRYTTWDYEYIFVDDKSTDQTKKIIEEIVIASPDLKIKKIFHAENLGRGQSVADGIRAASGKTIGFIDIDLEIGAHYVIPAVVLIESSAADFVMAWRIYKFALGGIVRAVLSRGYNFLARRLLRLPFNDTEAGFKFFSKEKILPVLDLVENKRWFWDTEIVAYAHKKKLKIVSLPTLFMRKPEKKTTVKLFRDSFDYFINLLKFRRRFLK